MKKKEAREIAIDYLYNAAESYYDILSKAPIDDFGTLSENGYTDDEYDAIKKELDFLIRKIFMYSPKPLTNQNH